MMIIVVPKLLEIFDDKSALPASTKTLIFISDIFVNYWYLLIFGAIAAYISVLLWKKTPA
jgi:type IV pilus assembly protein PilC